MSVTIEFPDAIARELHALMSAAELNRKVLEAVLLEAYHNGALSRGRLAELLGMGFQECEEFLQKKEVPYNYSLEALEEDRRAIELLIRTPTKGLSFPKAV